MNRANFIWTWPRSAPSLRSQVYCWLCFCIWASGVKRRRLRAHSTCNGWGADTDVQWVARLKQVTWIAWLDRGLRSLGLGFLVSLAGFILGVFALVVALPLTIGRLLSPYQLSSDKFYFDELYIWGIVKPLELAAGVLAWIDRNFVDGLVNVLGAVPRWLGAVFRNLQMGLVQFYALAMLLGIVVLLLASGVLWTAH